MPAADSQRERWLLLIHQVPPKPDYLRVKVRRRLDRIGAVALKNSVYVLPGNEEAFEDFQWLLREIVAEGGEASICEAAFIEGVSDEDLIGAFHAARDAEYEEIAAGARAISPRRSRAGISETGSTSSIAHLRRRLADVAAIDFFGAPGRAAAEDAIQAAETRLQRRASKGAANAKSVRRADLLQGRTWVTRRSVYVDRMASAWLIRRFIDLKARFKFVPPKGYRPAAGELRFDMYEAEYTHEGDSCTFETLLARFGLEEPALVAIGEIVHDLDLKDARFKRDEAPGVERFVAGIAASYAADDERLEHGGALFDALYESFRRSGGGGTRKGVSPG